MSNTSATNRIGACFIQGQSVLLRLILALLCLGVCALANRSTMAEQPEVRATSGTTETTEKANAELIKNAYDAFSRGDVPGAMAAFAEDIFRHVPGR